MLFLAQCDQFTSTCRGSTARIGTSLWRPDSRSACFSIRGDIGMAAKWLTRRDSGAHARHCVGVRPLLCRHLGCELEIPLYHTHRFLNRDYTMFDCSSIVFIETGFHASITIARRERPTAPLPTALLRCCARI